MARQSKPTVRELIQATLSSNNWKIDRWGNYTKMINGKKCRCKFQDRSMRFEQKNERSGIWVNIGSDYFKNIIVENNIIRVGKIQVI